MKFRKHFDYDVEKASAESAIDFTGQESLTVQSMAEDADINVMMDRYGITGKMPLNPRVPMYGDFTEVNDYQSALNALMAANNSFMSLPAKVRARFNNDPQELLEFCANGANIDEAQRLGLLKEKVNGNVEPEGRVAGERGRNAGPGGPPAEAGGAEHVDAPRQPGSATRRAPATGD